MATKRDGSGTGIGQLHFFGERRRPDRPEDVLDRRAVLGDGKMPAELRRLMSRESLYVNTGNNRQKPEIQIEHVDLPGDAGVWRVDVPVREGQRSAGALPMQTAIREKPEFFLSQTDPKASFTSFRPSWADASFAPKIRSRDQFPPMRRINGRPVDPLWVFGPDDRWSFQDASWPWGLVGKVFTSSGWTGSAALIGDRIIATASHLVPWNNNNAWMLFVPAFFDGKSLHGAGVQSFVTNAAGYNTGGNVVGYDWAVCRLDQPLGSMLGFFGYNGYDDDWNNDPYWSLIGYPAAIAGGQRPSFQGSTTVFDTDGDAHGGLEIETKADVTGGNSGGPMFSWWNGDPRLIGVVSGQEEDYIFPFSSEKGNVIAGGSGFTSLMAWGRTNWPL